MVSVIEFIAEGVGRYGSHCGVHRGRVRRAGKPKPNGDAKRCAGKSTAFDAKLSKATLFGGSRARRS